MLFFPRKNKMITKQTMVVATKKELIEIIKNS